MLHHKLKVAITDANSKKMFNLTLKDLNYLLMAKRDAPWYLGPYGFLYPIYHG